MIAYRTRVLRVISTTSDTLRSRGLRLMPPGAPQRPVRLGLILPPLVVESAAARPPLLAPYGPVRPAVAAAADAPQQQQQQTQQQQAMTGLVAEVMPGDASLSSSPAGTTTVAAAGVTGSSSSSAAAAARPPRARKRPLAFLPGGRLKEELVPLLVRVRGRSLDLCKHVGLRAFGEVFVPVDLSNAAAEPPRPSSDAAAAPAVPSRWVQLSSLQHALRQRVRHAAAAVTQAASGVPPVWRPPRGALGDLTLRVLLPRSVVARLMAASTMPLEATPHLGTPPAGAPQGAAAALPKAPPLVLELRSDCQIISVPVRLDPYIVGVMATSSAQPAAALATALLSGEAALQEQPLAGVGGGRAAAAAAPAGPATTAVQPSRWGVPAWLPWGQRPSAAGPAATAADAAAAEQQRKAAEEAEALRIRREQRRERRRALAAAAAQAGGAAWVEPWLPNGQAPAASPGATAAGGGAVAPAVNGTGAASHQPRVPAVGGSTATQQPTRALVGSSKRDPHQLQPVAGGSGGGSGTLPRPALGLRGGRLGPQLPPAGSKAAAAAPVAVGGSTAAVARRRARAGDALGSSRLPAVAATVDEIHLAGDQTVGGSAAGGNPITGMLSRVAKGLVAPFMHPHHPATAAAAAADAPKTLRPLPLPLPLPMPPRLVQTRSDTAAATAPARKGVVAHPVLQGTRFVMLPLTPADAPSSSNAALAPTLQQQQQQQLPQPLRGVDVLVLVTDVDSVLLNNAAAVQPLVAAAATAGRPVVALVLQPAANAPVQLAEEAQRALSELLGGRTPVVGLDVSGIDLRLAAQHAQHAFVAPTSSSAASYWAHIAAALPQERRSGLAKQVASARGALQLALWRGGDAGAGVEWEAPPAELSKL